MFQDLLSQGQNKKTGEIVAMKKIKLESEDEGVGWMNREDWGT